MKPVLSTILALALCGASDAGADFDGGGPALPPVETVLERMAECARQEAVNDREFKERYQFTRLKTTEVRNSRGELDKHEVKSQSNNPARAPGHPQSLQPKPAGSPGNREADKPNTTEGRGKPAHKSDFALGRDFLQRFQFTLAGRESVNGRPALMLDLAPAAKTPPGHNLKDRILNKTAGRIWVDEAESALVQARLRLTEKVNVVGGLAGSVVNFNLSFSRERTAEGLWFTRRSDWHLEGREVFARRTVNYREETTGVQLAAEVPLPR
jgi:hypothetical protein